MRFNQLTLILLLIGKMGFGQETKFLSEYYEFQKGETAFMFGNDVKLRDQPNTESNVLDLLKIGEPIEIIEKLDSQMEFDGIQSPWYKVKTRGKVGFVLGSLISLDKATNGNFIYLVSLKKDSANLFVKTRVLESAGQFKENISKLKTPDFSIKATGNKGLENIKSILQIDYLAESCGVNGGGIYLFYDGQTLLKAIDFIRVTDADIYWLIENYTFPNEPGGLKGKIIYNCEVGETKDPETEWTESVVTHRIVEWNGVEITPKIETEDN